MTIDNPPADPYDSVIADLQGKRDQLDAMIAALTSFRAAGAGLPIPISGQIAANDQVPASENLAGMFLGMSIVDAAKKLLGLRKQAMTNAEILAALKAGGVVLTGADPLNVVGSVLTRRFGQVGDVVRVARGTWGLKEWYPNRNFKPAVKVAAGTPSISEQEGVKYELQINDLGEQPDEDDDL